MKYHVKLEPSTVYDKDVVIEAESMSEAVEIARNRHCGKEQVEVSYRPEWVEPRPADADEDYEIFEYNHQVFGECVDCKVVLFESHEKNPDNDWPYQHHSADRGSYTWVCHPCAQKRKEKSVGSARVRIALLGLETTEFTSSRRPCSLPLSTGKSLC